MANSNAMRSARHASGVLAASMLLALGCAQRPVFTPGTDCELNSQCAAQLVCRLGRCRVECRSVRDCPVGLECVYDESGLGACQIEDERECALGSDCPTPLVCRFGRCTNACETDRDCPPGARCREDADGTRGCRDDADVECALNSDCATPYICAVDGRCREQCREDRDCRDGLVCEDAMEPAVCVRPGGPVDGGVDASLPGDAGVDPDGGPPPDSGVMTDGGMMTTVGPPLLGVGSFHACAAPTPGDVRCWGDNTFGQLGVGSFGGSRSRRR